MQIITIIVIKLDNGQKIIMQHYFLRKVDQFVSRSCIDNARVQDCVKFPQRLSMNLRYGLRSAKFMCENDSSTIQTFIPNISFHLCLMNLDIIILENAHAKSSYMAVDHGCTSMRTCHRTCQINLQIAQKAFESKLWCLWPCSQRLELNCRFSQNATPPTQFEMTDWDLLILKRVVNYSTWLDTTNCSGPGQFHWVNDTNLWAVVEKHSRAMLLYCTKTSLHAWILTVALWNW